MQVRTPSPLQSHTRKQEPRCDGSAIYSGSLSPQNTANSRWQAVWCGTMFNWAAGLPNPPQSLGWVCVCVCGVERSTGGCVCVDAEQLKTRFLVPVLIIIATVGVCLQQRRFSLPVFLQPHTVVGCWTDGCARRSLSGRCRHNWESGEEDEPDWHEKEEALVPCFSVFAHLQGGGVWMYLGKGVETQRRCWRRAAVPPCQCHWHVWSCLRAPGFKRMQELRLGLERATSEEA